jgi:hypothetical protein
MPDFILSAFDDPGVGAELPFVGAAIEACSAEWGVGETLLGHYSNTIRTLFEHYWELDAGMTEAKSNLPVSSMELIR